MYSVNLLCRLQHENVSNNLINNIAGEGMWECSEKKEKHGDLQFGVLGVGIRKEDRASDMFWHASHDNA